MADMSLFPHDSLSWNVAICGFASNTFFKHTPTKDRYKYDLQIKTCRYQRAIALKMLWMLFGYFIVYERKQVNEIIYICRLQIEVLEV